MAKKKTRLAVEIEFADGIERTLRPLTISQLRKFVGAQAELRKLQDDDDLSEESFDKMMDVAAIIMESVDPELAKNREELEQAVDLSAFWAMMSVAMGNDPDDLVPNS